MKVHELKICGDFADAVLEGRKTFEIRENDRGFQTGDLIKFIPLQKDGCIGWVPNRSHGLNGLMYEITYILNGWGLKNGYVALGIKPVEVVR